jgi:branched-subunit amino acid ABC-type transport system permease component
MRLFLEGINFGLITAAILALGAVAVSLQVSVTNFVNFAYGDFMTFGAYIAWIATSHGLNFILALLLAAIVTGLLGVAANVAVFRPFMKRKARPVTLLIVGLGLSLALQNAMTLIWSAEPHKLDVPMGNAIKAGPFIMTPGDLVIIIASVSLLVSLHLMLTYTTFGKAQRATANNLELAQACGIDSQRVITITWFIAGILTAAAGIGLALEVGTVYPGLGFTSLFVILGAVILGGLGKPYGALLGAVIVGMMTEISGVYLSAAYKSSVAFAFVIVLLLFRPQGLFAVKGKTS